MSDIAVTVAGPEGWERVKFVDERAFGYTWPAAGSEPHRAVLEMDRTVIATVDGTDAGVASTYSLDMSVPGGRLPVAGLTWVGVLPTYRRRGVLTAMMRDHLDGLRDGGEAVAALYAAEPAIYGRFGYGLASTRFSVSIPREFARLTVGPRPDDPEAVLAEPEDVRPQLALVNDAVAAARAGMPARSPVWWDRTLNDSESDRGGGSALRALVVRDDQAPRAYALYRTKEAWGLGGANGEIEIREAMAADPAAHRVLWSVLLGTDLVGTTSYRMLPLDDPLLHLLVDPRRACPTVIDALYVRLVDVARALTGRTYAVPVDVVLDVTDPFAPWNTGRWRLSGGPEGATCAPTTEPADLALDVRELGAIYLGGTPLRPLADAGLVDEQRLGAVDAVTTAFRTPRAPWCPFVF